MFSVLLALAAAQASPPACKAGTKCNPFDQFDEPWKPPDRDPIVAIPDGHGGYEPPPPKLGPGRQELVAHWPGSGAEADYHRVYSSGAACLKARAAVLDENARRLAANEADAESRGYRIVAPAASPYVMCVPIE